MPKSDIDYSNTIIYKIICKDENIKDIYVGHTTNFIQRKHAHKQACKNINCLNYNCKLYNVIRANGDWNNWIMAIIAFYSCKNSNEARAKEQEHYEELKANLNGIPPCPQKSTLVEKTIFHCEKCNIYTSSQKVLDIHYKTTKHIKSLTETPQKSHAKFCCENCDYLTNNKKDFNKHLATDKHKMFTDVDADINKKSPKTPLATFICDCGKKYKYRQSLYVHKKKCNFKEEELKEENNNYALTIQDQKDELDYKDMFFKMVEENREVRTLLITQQHQLENQQNQIMEIIPKIGNNTTNNNNQNYNINVFLNEKCKDAINMSDFIKSMEVSLEQLDYTKNKGLVAGLSNTIIENMNKLGIYERPIHCTDVKRETLYVKDNDVWDKESSKEKIKYAISKTSGKNYNALQNWKKDNPDYIENDAKQDYFAHTLSTIGKPTIELGEKIIKKICVETYIKDKQ